MRYSRTVLLHLVALSLVVSLGACAPPPATGGAQPTKELRQATPVAGESAPSLSQEIELQNAAASDLADRLGVTRDEIVVIEMTEIASAEDDSTCPDAATLPGEGAVQQITVAVGEQQYAYRGRGDEVVYCGESPAQGGSTGGGLSPEEQAIMDRLDPDGRNMTLRAREELAAKLGIEPSEITISGAEAVNWPDSSLGCPQPGMMYAQVITPGYSIALEHGGQPYTYHAGGGHMVLCENEENEE